MPEEINRDRRRFVGAAVTTIAHRVINGGVGHNLPQEAPEAIAQAIVDVDGYAVR
jgi:cell division septation protein DedD